MVDEKNMLDESSQLHLLGIAHHMIDVVGTDIACAATNPSVLYRPALSIDGNMWCALYGANLQDGVAGFGKSPELAMKDFDANWRAFLKDTIKPR